jgi:hypothetical protein
LSNRGLVWTAFQTEKVPLGAVKVPSGAVDDDHERADEKTNPLLRPPQYRDHGSTVTPVERGHVGQRKIKRKKPARPEDFTYPVADSDFLLTWLLDLPPNTKDPALLESYRDMQVEDLFAIQKFGFLEEARTLAKRVPNGYMVMSAFLDADARDRALENIRNREGSPGLMQRECPVPETRGAGFGPLGCVFPLDVLSEVTDMLATDADVIESCALGMAERMEKHPDVGDFLFPDLSPEAYAEAVKLREKRKKPQ